MSHSVRRHLRVEIDAYDRTIRRFVPGYEAMLRAASEQIAAAADGGLVLELGAGTGAFSEAILANERIRTVELIDTDPEMLERARIRLARFKGRVRFEERSFDEPLPPCNAVAASLTLHHVPSMDRKRALYRRIHDTLLPAGVFVNADVTMPASAEERDAVYRGWVRFMGSCGIDEDQAYRHFEDWSEEDTYFPLEDEMEAMTAAGFETRCTWREGPMAVLAGRRRGGWTDRPRGSSDRSIGEPT